MEITTVLNAQVIFIETADEEKFPLNAKNLKELAGKIKLMLNADDVVIKAEKSFVLDRDADSKCL